MYWDPFDPYGRARRRRLEEQRRREEARRRAEQEALRRALTEEESRRHATPPSPPPTPELVARFEAELVQARRERDEWEDRYNELLQSWEASKGLLEQERAQLQAEAEASRERLRRNAEQRAFEETRKTLQRLLEVADNLERALAQVGKEPSPLAEGVRLTYQSFLRALEQSGVEQVVSQGQPFNPALHNAVATRASDEAEAGTVVEELSPGYLYRGTLLRPARVIVAG